MVGTPTTTRQKIIFQSQCTSNITNNISAETDVEMNRGTDIVLYNNETPFDLNEIVQEYTFAPLIQSIHGGAQHLQTFRLCLAIHERDQIIIAASPSWP